MSVINFWSFQELKEIDLQKGLNQDKHSDGNTYLMVLPLGVAVVAITFRFIALGCRGRVRDEVGYTLDGSIYESFR